MNAILSTGLEYYQEAFALSLLNSIWIGAIVVFICWFFRQFSNSNYKINNWLAVISLILIALSCVVNFVGLNLLGNEFRAMITKGEEWLNLGQNAYWINRIWLIGASLFFIKFFISHCYLKRLINQSKVLSDPRWVDQYQRAKSYFLVRKQVVLLHSEHISSAFITGVLKPLIIIPTSWINQLTTKEVECILAHEFSHIMNKDHWINVFVQVMEIMFFFNPAVHILISHIKLDRELQADRMACGFAGEPMVYAKLILKVEENKTVLPALSIPFFRQKNQLRQRIESVLELPCSRKNTQSWYALGFLLIGLLLSGIQQKPTGYESALECSIRNEKFNQHRINQSEIIATQEIELQEVKKKRKQIKRDHISRSKTVKKIKEKEHQLEFEIEELIAFEYDERTSIIKEINQSNQDGVNKSFRIITRSKSDQDSSQFRQDGGSWITSKRIRCYSPAEPKTIIIIQTDKKETRIFENEDTTPGLIQIGSNNIY